jgi:hypothetical protein
VFYDDVDPKALDTGIVTIRQTALPRLWEICRARGFGVVADVHVHPRGYGQSESDRANPVMPRAGHLALILPNFARERPRPGTIGEKKTKVADAWLEASGWQTQLVERRHLGDVAITDEDPPCLLSGLDRLEPRLTLARHGFPYMLDAGIGHGPGDFEGIQIRTIAKGQSIEGLWDKPKKPDESAPKGLLSSQAYVELERHVGQCGTVEFAEASAAVPFVRAATGALVIAQAIRLASLEPAPVFVQMELGAPEMTTLGGLIAQPEINLGSFSMRLEDRTPLSSFGHTWEAPAGGGA